MHNFLNTRYNFSGNFDIWAGSFDRLISDPVLATGGCMRISNNFQQCNFGNYNPFALGNTITGADRRTNICIQFELNEETHFTIQLHLFCGHLNIYGTCPK